VPYTVAVINRDTDLDEARIGTETGLGSKSGWVIHVALACHGHSHLRRASRFVPTETCEKIGL